MIKSLIFDLGGVLVPEARDTIRSEVSHFLNIKTTDLINRTIDLSQKIHRGELSLRDFYELALSRFDIKSITPEQVVLQHIESYKKHSLIMDSEILRLIEKLRSNNYRVAAATNTEKDIYDLSRRRGYHDLFDENFVSLEMKMAKPEYQFFGKMLDILDSDPRETVFIDDSAECISRSCKIGMNGVLYKNFTNLIIDLNA